MGDLLVGLLCGVRPLSGVLAGVLVVGVVVGVGVEGFSKALRFNMMRKTPRLLQDYWIRWYGDGAEIFGKASLEWVWNGDVAGNFGRLHWKKEWCCRNDRDQLHVNTRSNE